MPTQDKETYEQAAQRTDPAGEYCGFCDKLNDFADDCGFFYCVDVRNGEIRDDSKWKPGPLKNPCRPICNECWKVYGPIHQKYYGVGER